MGVERFTLNNHKLRGKLFLRHNFIIIGTVSVLFYLFMVKMHALFRILAVRGNCVAAIGAMRFSCAASAAHFLFHQYALQDSLCSIFTKAYDGGSNYHATAYRT